MNKSLLELLEAEKNEIINIRRSKKSAEDFIINAESLKKEYQKESYYMIAKEYEARAKMSEEKLIGIRKEIKQQYLSFLLEIE